MVGVSNKCKASNEEEDEEEDEWCMCCSSRVGAVEVVPSTIDDVRNGITTLAIALLPLSQQLDRRRLFVDGGGGFVDGGGGDSDSETEESAGASVGDSASF